MLQSNKHIKPLSQETSTTATNVGVATLIDNNNNNYDQQVRPKTAAKKRRYKSYIIIRSGGQRPPERPKIVLATCVSIYIIIYNYLSGFEISSVCDKRIRPMKLKIKPTNRVTRKCVT